MLGWSRFPEAKPEGLGPHRHPDAFEICFLIEGAVEWWVGERGYRVQRGDLFVTRPDEPHGGSDAVMHPCELFWVQVAFPTALDAPLDGLARCQTEHLHAGLLAIEDRRFSASAEIPACFATLLREYRRAEADVLRATVAARAALHTLLVTTLRDYDRHRSSAAQRAASAPSDPLTIALVWMEARLGESFRIGDVAAAVGMRPQAFYERFVREVGQTPADWRMRRRIAEAERRLTETDERITDIAFALGFPTSQYFATAFKRYTGFSPSAYRRARLSPPA